jgi:hypothetical protein
LEVGPGLILGTRDLREERHSGGGFESDVCGTPLSFSRVVTPVAVHFRFENPFETLVQTRLSISKRGMAGKNGVFVLRLEAKFADMS